MTGRPLRSGSSGGSTQGHVHAPPGKAFAQFLSIGNLEEPQHGGGAGVPPRNSAFFLCVRQFRQHQQPTPLAVKPDGSVIVVTGHTQLISTLLLGPAPSSPAHA